MVQKEQPLQGAEHATGQQLQGISAHKPEARRAAQALRSKPSRARLSARPARTSSARAPRGGRARLVRVSHKLLRSPSCQQRKRSRVNAAVALPCLRPVQKGAARTACGSMSNGDGVVVNCCGQCTSEHLTPSTSGLGRHVAQHAGAGPGYGRELRQGHARLRVLRGGGRRGALSLGTASRVHTKADRHTKATGLAALPVLSTEPIIRDVPLQMSGEVGVNMGSQSFLTHPPSGLARICMQAPWHRAEQASRARPSSCRRSSRPITALRRSGKVRPYHGSRGIGQCRRRGRNHAPQLLSI